MGTERTIATRFLDAIENEIREIKKEGKYSLEETLSGIEYFAAQMAASYLAKAIEDSERIKSENQIQ